MGTTEKVKQQAASSVVQQPLEFSAFYRRKSTATVSCRKVWIIHPTVLNSLEILSNKQIDGKQPSSANPSLYQIFTQLYPSRIAAKFYNRYINCLKKKAVEHQLEEELSNTRLIAWGSQSQVSGKPPSWIPPLITGKKTTIAQPRLVPHLLTVWKAQCAAWRMTCDVLPQEGISSSAQSTRAHITARTIIACSVWRRNAGLKGLKERRRERRTKRARSRREETKRSQPLQWKSRNNVDSKVSRRKAPLPEDVIRSRGHLNRLKFQEVSFSHHEQANKEVFDLCFIVRILPF